MKREAGRWAVVFIMAHELGHHVEGHTITGRGSHHKAEYQADAFATRMLKRLGASVHDATRAMEAMPAPTSGTHPSSRDRIRRIREVYGAESAPSGNADQEDPRGASGPRAPTGGGVQPGLPPAPPTPVGQCVVNGQQVILYSDGMVVDAIGRVPQGRHGPSTNPQCVSEMVALNGTPYCIDGMGQVWAPGVAFPVGGCR